jgi:predicted ATP-grasp superfamily ATP-dependent carboligase
MRVLLTGGSGLTSRQAAGLLSASGHEVEVLSPDPLCLARFTRHVKRVRRVPSYGADPLRWLAAALEIYREGAFDVILPTQEQVAVLAAFPQKLHDARVNTAVPSFAALSAVQDKLSAWRTLSDLAIPQPFASEVTDGWTRFPAYMKQPIGTASGGVRRIEDPTGLRIAGDADAVLIQASVEGPLVMCQSVFDSGTLVAFHAALRVAEGANGGASHKRGIDLPAARESLECLGRALDWNGALSADVIVGSDGPLVIDVNPRLVEPVNAARSGIDLVGALVVIATGGHPAPAPVRGFRPDVATHQLVLAVLGAAVQGAGRRGVVSQLWQALRHKGLYADSHEELTPIRGDPLSAVPLVRATVATLLRPSSGADLASGSVANYALSPAGWKQIRTSAEPPPDQCASTG